MKDIDFDGSHVYASGADIAKCDRCDRQVAHGEPLLDARHANTCRTIWLCEPCVHSMEAAFEVYQRKNDPDTASAFPKAEGSHA